MDAANSKVYATPAAEYCPSPGEMRLLLEDAGMQMTETLGDHDGHPFPETALGRDVIMIAQPRPRLRGGRWTGAQ